LPLSLSFAIFSPFRHFLFCHDTFLAIIFIIFIFSSFFLISIISPLISIIFAYDFLRFLSIIEIFSPLLSPPPHCRFHFRFFSRFFADAAMLRQPRLISLTRAAMRASAPRLIARLLPPSA
jgi:hypothetical protein